MIADSPPVDGFNGSLGVVRVKLAPLAGFFRWFSQRLAVEREAVRGVHELAAIFFGEGIQRFMWGRVRGATNTGAGLARPHINRIGLNRLFGAGRYGDWGERAGVGAGAAACCASGTEAGGGAG